MSLCPLHFVSCKKRLDAHDDTVAGFKLEQQELKESIDKNWSFTHKNRQKFEALSKNKEICKVIERHLPVIQRKEENNFLSMDDRLTDEVLQKNDSTEEVADICKLWQWKVTNMYIL